MKRLVFIGLFLLGSTSADAQLHVNAFAGVNSTRLSKGYFGFEKGGNFLFGGVELEGVLKPKRHSPFKFSFLTGATYLNNGYFENSLFSFANIFYTASMTDLSTTYVQIPLMAKLNWQPFPLLDDFQLFIGAGITNNLLLKAQLRESVTKVFIATDIYSPPQTTHYQDNRDITSLGVQNALFYRIDMGMRYRRLLVSYRLSQSFGDMYYQGLESVWAVPATESGYISGHKNAGSTREKYSELVVGMRLF
jgi:hypothetical protein